MKYRVLAICFLALIGLQPPSYAAVIKPGTYQMKWVYTPKQDRSEMSAAALKLAKATVEQRKSLKLVSEKALWGSQSGWTAALDESRGTGKGYDIAYVTCKRFAKPGWVTVPLIEDRSPTCEYKYHSDYNRPIPMDITIGPAESGRRRVKSAIGVDVHIDEGQSPRLNVRQYGYMEGSLRTDSGPLCVRLYDWNTTGIFGDVHGNPATIVLRTDGGKHAVAGTNDEQTQKVDSVLLFDGKLYSLKVSPGGRSMTVGRYAGPAGKLAVNAAIGSRQLSGFKVGVQAHLNEYWFQPKLPINLPPDELIFVHVQIDDKTELVAQRQVKITAGHTTNVSIGGPLALSIDSGNDQMVSAKAGGTARFYLDLSAGDDMYFVPQKATLSITGPDGQSVSIAPGVKDITEPMCDTIHFKVPSTWKGGDYKIDAKAEANGQRLTASKTLRITDDSASQPQPPADSRLDQKVTLTSTGKRLHTVLDELSAKTGVKIDCGASADDWQVRDIPIVVCAKELALGRLLNTIAASTHLTLAWSEVGGTNAYTIRRDPETKKSMDSYLSAKHSNNLAVARWSWDVSARLADIPDSDIKVLRSSYLWAPSKSPLPKAISRLIKVLGPGVRDKVVAGETIRLVIKDLRDPTRKIARTAFVEAARLEHSQLRDRSTPGPTDDDIDNGYLQFLPDDARDRSDVSIRFLTPLQSDPTQGVLWGWLSLETIGTLTGFVDGHDDIPERPEPPGPPGPRYTDWEAPVWQTKVITSVPGDGLDLTFGDALAKLSAASGMSIITTDFVSHQPGAMFGQMGKSKVTLKDCLLPLTYYVVWSVDKESNLIFGVDRDWPLRQASLVPGMLVDAMDYKMNHDGLSIDDIAEYTRLSASQTKDWRPSTRSWFQPQDIPIWTLYSFLSEEDKAKAKSDAGLSLAGCDTAELAGLFKTWNRQTEALRPPCSTDSLLPTDPKVIASSSLAIRSKTGKDPLGRRRYWIQVFGEQNGRPFSVNVSGIVDYLPLYTRERTMQLAEQAKVQYAPASPAGGK